MWSGNTERKVLPVRKSLRRWRLLCLWSVAPLLIAVIAALVGFRDASPGVSGGARYVCIFAALAFVGLAGVGLAVRRRSG
jgi:hypothetical protein